MIKFKRVFYSNTLSVISGTKSTLTQELTNMAAIIINTITR
jgi:hypothetical protein